MGSEMCIRDRLGNDQEERPFLYREFSGYGGQQFVRVGDWKAIRTDTSKGKLELELYNLREDIGEKNNIAAANPEKLAELKKLMDQQHVPSKIFPLGGVDTPATKPRQRNKKK